MSLPILHMVITLHLGALVQMCSADVDLVKRLFGVIDERLDEIRGIHAELKEAGAAAVVGGKAEIAGTRYTVLDLVAR